MSELQTGQQAPEFTLPASTGGEISLADFRGQQQVVLYFYPKDMTPGCTVEACSFRDTQADFAEAGAAILGVSADDLDSHAKFTEKHELNFPLLSDAGGQVAQTYGVWKEKGTGDQTHMGMERTTFLIDKEGVIRRIWPQVKVDEHAEEVLAAVRELG